MLMLIINNFQLKIKMKHYLELANVGCKNIAYLFKNK